MTGTRWPESLSESGCVWASASVERSRHSRTSLPHRKRDQPDERQRYQIGSHWHLAGNKMCGMIARRSFQARTLSPSGAAYGRGFQAHAARRHVRACRLKILIVGGSDGGTRAIRCERRVETWRRDRRPPSDSKSQRKTRGGYFRHGLYDFRDDDVLPLICPTGQLIF